MRRFSLFSLLESARVAHKSFLFCPFFFLFFSRLWMDWLSSAILACLPICPLDFLSFRRTIRKPISLRPDTKNPGLYNFLLVFCLLPSHTVNSCSESTPHSILCLSRFLSPSTLVSSLLFVSHCIHPSIHLSAPAWHCLKLFIHAVVPILRLLPLYLSLSLSLFPLYRYWMRGGVVEVGSGWRIEMMDDGRRTATMMGMGYGGWDGWR